MNKIINYKQPRVGEVRPIREQGGDDGRAPVLPVLDLPGADPAPEQAAVDDEEPVDRVLCLLVLVDSTDDAGG